MTLDEINSMAHEAGAVAGVKNAVVASGDGVVFVPEELAHFAALVAEKAMGEPVGRVTGDGAVTWLAPIPEEGADLYAGPFRARSQQ